MNSKQTLKLNFSIYDAELPKVTSSKIFTNKNEFHEDGLYSQKIFGPVKNYECQCGKLKGKLFKGQRCDKCGVLCDTNELRMKTFAQIELPQDVYVILPPLRYILDKIFGKKNVNKILAFDPHVHEKADFYLYDLKNLTLVSIDKLINYKKFESDIKKHFQVDDIIDIEPKDFLAYRNEYIENFMTTVDRDRYLVDHRVYSVINLKKLYEYLIENHIEIFNEAGINTKILKYVFINKIPVTPPDTRPVLKIGKNKFSVNEITKAYSEILKNTEHKFTDSIYQKIEDEVERDIYLANAVKKFQKSVDSLYLHIQEKQFGEKSSVFRSSILGKTVEFSGRTVVTCGPNLPPYMLSLPREFAKVIFILETLNYLVNNENDILDINDVASIMQLLTNGIQEAELNIDNDQFDEIFEKIRPKLRVMFERPPTLFMYNDSTFILDQLFEKKFKIDN